MQTVAAAALASVIQTWMAVFGFMAILTALELAAPRGAALSMIRRLWGLLFWIPLIAANVCIAVAFHEILMGLGWHPIHTLDLNVIAGWAGPLAPLVAAVLAAMIADLTFYWLHRAQHAWPLLWRFHATHHSIRDLGAVNSYHHISEAVVRLVLTGLPLCWLDIHAEGATAIGALFSVQVIAIHCPTKLHAGPLRRILVDNRFHRIHHSIKPAHFDTNFGANFTLWDQLFGTAYFPAAKEWPDVGLSDVAQSSGLGDWLVAPFTRGRLEGDRAETSESGSIA